MSQKKIAWVGIPFDDFSSFMKGTSKGPEEIIKAYHSDSTNYFTEGLHNIEEDERIQFAGILPIKTYDDIYNHYLSLLKIYNHIIGLGGDHSITYPILRAQSSIHGPINVIQFDAHPDLYDELDGNRFSHACPFARAHEDGLINQHIQIGIRSHTPFQVSQAKKYKVHQYYMSEFPWNSNILSRLKGKWYISLDLDVLDPAFAPGISHHEPGGMSSRMLITMIQSLSFNLIGADIVELNPKRDIHNMTAMLAAKLLKEMSSKMLNQ